MINTREGVPISCSNVQHSAHCHRFRLHWMCCEKKGGQDLLSYTILLSGEIESTLRTLTLNLLTTTIVAPPSNASKWQMGFNSVFKGLK